MQLLLSQAAFERIETRLRGVAPDIDVVTVATPEIWMHRGKTIAAGQVNPDLAWLSNDVFRAGLLPSMLTSIQNAPHLKWVQIFLAGLDNPAFKVIIGKGIRLTKSSAQAVSIAEYITAHAFSLIVPIKAQQEAQSRSEWKPTPYREISQTRWTLIGFGAIGTEVAKRLKPYGVHLTVVRRHAGPSNLADEVVETSRLPDVLPKADVVVLACALNDQTRHMGNDAFFNAMKENAILINIGRGALIDDEALRRGLDRNKPGQAVLDVFATEPLPADNWMWTHPAIRVSAHTSPFGSGTSGRGDELFLENLKRYLAGDKLLNEATRADVGLS